MLKSFGYLVGPCVFLQLDFHGAILQLDYSINFSDTKASDQNENINRWFHVDCVKRSALDTSI